MPCTRQAIGRLTGPVPVRRMRKTRGIVLLRVTTESRYRIRMRRNVFINNDPAVERKRRLTERVVLLPRRCQSSHHKSRELPLAHQVSVCGAMDAAAAAPRCVELGKPLTHRGNCWQVPRQGAVFIVQIRWRPIYCVWNDWRRACQDQRTPFGGF